MAQTARHPSVDITDTTPAHTAATLRPDRHHTHGHKVAIVGWRLYEAYRLHSFLSFTARPGRAVGKLRCWAHAPSTAETCLKSRGALTVRAVGRRWARTMEPTQPMCWSERWCGAARPLMVWGRSERRSSVHAIQPSKARSAVILYCVSFWYRPRALPLSQSSLSGYAVVPAVQTVLSRSSARLHPMVETATPPSSPASPA